MCRINKIEHGVAQRINLHVPIQWKCAGRMRVWSIGTLKLLWSLGSRHRFRFQCVVISLPSTLTFIWINCLFIWNEMQPLNAMYPLQCTSLSSAWKNKQFFFLVRISIQMQAKYLSEELKAHIKCCKRAGADEEKVEKNKCKQNRNFFEKFIFSSLHVQ